MPLKLPKNVVATPLTINTKGFDLSLCFIGMDDGKFVYIPIDVTFIDNVAITDNLASLGNTGVITITAQRDRMDPVARNYQSYSVAFYVSDSQYGNKYGAIQYIFKPLSITQTPVSATVATYTIAVQEAWAYHMDIADFGAMTYDIFGAKEDEIPNTILASCVNDVTQGDLDVYPPLLYDKGLLDRFSKSTAISTPKNFDGTQLIYNLWMSLSATPNIPNVKSVGDALRKLCFSSYYHSSGVDNLLKIYKSTSAITAKIDDSFDPHVNDGQFLTNNNIYASRYICSYSLGRALTTFFATGAVGEMILQPDTLSKMPSPTTLRVGSRIIESDTSTIDTTSKVSYHPVLRDLSDKLWGSSDITIGASGSGDNNGTIKLTLTDIITNLCKTIDPKFIDVKNPYFLTANPETIRTTKSINKINLPRLADMSDSDHINMHMSNMFWTFLLKNDFYSVNLNVGDCHRESGTIIYYDAPKRDDDTITDGLLPAGFYVIMQVTHILSGGLLVDNLLLVPIMLT